MVRVDRIDDPKDLAAIEGSWDELAVAAGKPYCAPGWMLAWWNAAAPSGARLRVVVVTDGEQLVGVAPGWERDRRGSVCYELLAAPVSLRVEPLAQPGRERDVAESVCDALGRSPRVNVLSWKGVPEASRWRGWIAEAFPGRTTTLPGLAMPAPFVPLAGSTYEEWFASKSRNFREQMRRNRRRLERSGAVFRIADPDTVASDVRALVNLHLARWSERGGSSVMATGVERMLLDAAAALLDGDRFRLHCIELEGAVISAHLFLAAGGEVSYWLGGFDESWAREQPAMQSLLHGLERAWELGDTRVDLGGGGQHYKYRLAERDEQLVWAVSVPRGPGYSRALAASIPEWGKRAVLARVPDGLKTKVKKALGRPS